MNNPIINPRTKRPLSEKAASILRLMTGASYYEGERRWPMLSSNFGANAETIRALESLERAALIERTKPATMQDHLATIRNYRITDAARTLLAGELTRKKANEERRLAERHAESLRQEQERAERKAAEDDIARKLAAFPDLLTALREVRVKLDLSLECEYRNESDSLMIEARTLVDIAISNATGEPLW